MRCFLAIPCSGAVASALESPRDTLNERTSLNPVKTTNFHLTIKFLGETGGGQLEDLERAFHSRLPTPGPLTLSVHQVGVFPNVKSPSVAWAGIEPTIDLQRLHESVESIAVDLGFEPEDHDFTPHVTLGRFKQGSRHSETVLNWIKEYEGTQFGTFEATRIRLYESELSEDGPNYTERVNWPL